jgi:polyisoprenoid-binding protein YceI
MTENAFDPATTVVDDIKGEYALDPTHTRLGFSTRHAMVTTVRGAFTDFSGEAVVDTENPAASKVTVTIKAASTDTGVADRDGHLRSPDFFDVETYPEITFSSTDVARDGDDWTVTGDLTIKDVTRSVTIPLEFQGAAKDPFGNDRIGFEGELVISRKDWGVTWNVALETGGVLVSDKVTLEFEISAIKQA